MYKKDEVKLMEYKSAYGTYYKILVFKRNIFGTKKWIRIEEYSMLEHAKKAVKFLIEGVTETEITI